MTKGDREGGKESRYSWARLCCAPKAKLSWTPEELCEPSFSQRHALLWSSFEDKSPAKALASQLLGAKPSTYKKLPAHCAVLLPMVTALNSWKTWRVGRAPGTGAWCANPTHDSFAPSANQS